MTTQDIVQKLKGQAPGSGLPLHTERQMQAWALHTERQMEAEKCSAQNQVSHSNMLECGTDVNEKKRVDK